MGAIALLGGCAGARRGLVGGEGGGGGSDGGTAIADLAQPGTGTVTVADLSVGGIGGGGGADLASGGKPPTFDLAPPPMNCATRLPPAGWTRLTNGGIQNYGAQYYYFTIADSTQYANMFGFNDRAMPSPSTVYSSGYPYTEPVGPPGPILYPNFPGHAETNAVFGYGPHKFYYALRFQARTFPEPSGGTSMSFNFTGSSSNYGTVSTISISECPGDFGADLSGCINPQFFSEAQFLYVVSGTPGATGPTVCHLTPGRTYYFNIAPAKNYDWTQSSCGNAWCWTTLIAYGQTCPGGPNNNCDP